MGKIKAITIDELAKACQAQIKEGNGKKKILLSDDDEGNGYHEMFYLFTPVEEFGIGEKYGPVVPREVEKNVGDYIVLG